VATLWSRLTARICCDFAVAWAQNFTAGLEILSLRIARLDVCQRLNIGAGARPKQCMQAEKCAIDLESGLEFWTVSTGQLPSACTESWKPSSGSREHISTGQEGAVPDRPAKSSRQIIKIVDYPERAPHSEFRRGFQLGKPTLLRDSSQSVTNCSK